MKIYSTSYAIREFQIKTKWDTPAHLLEWLKSKTSSTLIAGMDLEQEELSFIAGGNSIWDSHIGKHLAVSHKAKQSLPCLSNELNIYVHTNIYTPMFIATLFIIAKSWKQTTVSFNSWMSKTVVYPCHGRIVSNKNKWAVMPGKD